MRHVILRLAAAALAASPATAQVSLDSNQIVGRIGFVNSNPEILDAVSEPVQRVVVAGESLSLGAAAWTTGTGTTHGDARFELTVDTVDDGLAYRLQSCLVTEWTEYRHSIVVSEPVRPEPEPDVTRDLFECASLLRLRFQDPAGNPVAVQNVSVKVWPAAWREVAEFREHFQARLSAPLVSETNLLVSSSDVPQDVEIQFGVGSDPSSDLLLTRLRLLLTLPCDEVVERILVVRTGTPGDPLPRIIGEADILGAEEIDTDDGPGEATLVSARGPWGNVRTDRLARTPSSGPYELENLLPSSVEDPPHEYLVRARMLHGIAERRGDFLQMLDGVIVPGSGTLDLGDAFVVDPGVIHADVRLVGPPGSADPVLADMLVFADRDGDGDLDAPRAAPTIWSDAWCELTSDWDWRGRDSTNAVLAFDPVTGEVRGDADLVLGAPVRPGGSCDGAVEWMPWRLNLTYEDHASAGDPAAWHDGQVHVSEFRDGVPVAAGTSLDEPFHYCVSEVHLGVLSDVLTFTAPSFEVVGGEFAGVDFSGRSVRYDATQTQAAGLADPADPTGRSGLVVGVIPQGAWTLSVRVQAANPGGGTSSVTLVEFPLEVGCRQVLTLSTDIRAEVADLPPCTGPGLVHVGGRVLARRAVQRIAWSLDGGPWTDVCLSCGLNPTFAFDVVVPSADSSLVVQAWDDAGSSASVIAFTGLTGEPSARDLDPAVIPLTVEKSAAGLRLTWEPRATDEFTLHQGTIAALSVSRAYDHGAIAPTCRQPGAARDVAMPAGSAYFLVTESCKNGNGSFGRDSFGRERPRAVTGCP